MTFLLCKSNEMSNFLAAINKSSKLASGAFGTVFKDVEPSEGYSFRPPAPILSVHEVYKFQTKKDDRNKDLIRDEVSAIEMIKHAFTSAGVKFEISTPFCRDSMRSLEWIGPDDRVTGEPTTGMLNYIPLRRFKQDGARFFGNLLSYMQTEEVFRERFDGMMFVFMRFLDVIHAEHIFHMDFKLNNTLFQGMDEPHLGVPTDFGCTTGPNHHSLYLGSRLGGNAWVNPLLTRDQNGTWPAPQHPTSTKDTWERYAPGKFAAWFDVAKKRPDGMIDSIPEPVLSYIDFHEMARSLMVALTGFRGSVMHAAEDVIRSVITQLVGDHRTPLKPEGMYAALHQIILPTEAPPTSHVWLSARIARGDSVIDPLDVYSFGTTLSVLLVMVMPGKYKAPKIAQKSARASTSTCDTEWIRKIFGVVSRNVQKTSPRFYTVSYMESAFEISSKAPDGPSYRILATDVSCLFDTSPEMFMTYVVAQLLKLSQTTTQQALDAMLLEVGINIDLKLAVLNSIAV